MKFIDWSPEIQLYSQIAGSLAGIIFICITLFISRTKEERAGQQAEAVMVLLASDLWSLIAAAFLYAEASGHIPKQQLGSTPVILRDYQSFELLSLMGAFTFASSLAQTFLCICFVFQAHFVSHELSKFANRLVLAMIIVIVAQMAATVEYAIRVELNQSLDYISWQIWSLGATLLIPILIIGWRRQKQLFGGANGGLIQLAYGSLALAVMAVVMSANFSTQSGEVAENIYITVCYAFMIILGIVLGQCLACLPSVPLENNSGLSISEEITFRKGNDQTQETINK